MSMNMAVERLNELPSLVIVCFVVGMVIIGVFYLVITIRGDKV